MSTELPYIFETCSGSWFLNQGGRCYSARPMSQQWWLSKARSHYELDSTTKAERPCNTAELLIYNLCSLLVRKSSHFCTCCQCTNKLLNNDQTIFEQRGSMSLRTFSKICFPELRLRCPNIHLSSATIWISPLRETLSVYHKQVNDVCCRT